MRDARRTKQYFDEWLDERDELIHQEDSIEIYYSRWEADKNGLRKLTALTSGYTELFLHDVSFMYCRGDELAEIKRLRIDPVLDRYLFLCGEMQGHYQKHIYSLIDDCPNDFYTIYTWLCWMLCFGADREKVGKITPYLCEAGKDRLLDAIASHYEPGRDIGVGCANPKTFGLLDQLFDAEASRYVAIVETYLEDWPVYMGQLDLGTIGINCGTNLKSREDLIASINDNYQGFWAWEVALVVKFFGIDDSSFRDNEFYPHDLVHFTDEFGLFNVTDSRKSDLAQRN